MHYEHVASLSDFQIWAWGRKKVVKLRFMMSIISWTCLSKYWTRWFRESYWFERGKKLNIHFRMCWPTDATLHYVNFKRLPLCPILTYELTQETLQPKCDNKYEWSDILMPKRWEWRWSLLLETTLLQDIWNWEALLIRRRVLYFEFYRMPCTLNFLFIAIMKTVPGYISGKVPRLRCVEVICWGCGRQLFLLQLRSMWKLDVSDGILL